MNQQSADVHVVTVTYGNRADLLHRAVDVLLENALVKKIHIVSNAADFSLPTHEKIAPIELAANTGSANGYKRGIEQALSADAQFIWLLDDDNCGAEDVLNSLLNQFGRSPSALLAVTGRRPGRTPNTSSSRVASSFLGFRFSDIPTKLVQRLWRNTASDSTAPIEVASCPYGGLLFKPALIEAIGLPREDFVLYADDLEFTGRISAAGGRLLWVPTIQIEDFEPSWNVAARGSSSLSMWLSTPGDAKAYYSARNLAFLEQKAANDSMAFRLNRAIYTGFLAVYATVFGKFGRFRILLEAFEDAKIERLGLNPRYPLG